VRVTRVHIIFHAMGRRSEHNLNLIEDWCGLQGYIIRALSLNQVFYEVIISFCVQIIMRKTSGGDSFWEVIISRKTSGQRFFLRSYYKPENFGAEILFGRYYKRKTSGRGFFLGSYYKPENFGAEILFGSYYKGHNFGAGFLFEKLL